MGDRQTWRGSAACQGLALEFDNPGKDFFFILPGRKSKRAKLFCHECPVKRECLEFALIYEEQGIWGGTTEEERKEFPSYIVEALRKRERETVGMESRNMDDFIPRQYSYSITHQVTVIETRSFQVVLDYSPQSEGVPLDLQLEVLDRLFVESSALLESLT